MLLAAIVPTPAAPRQVDLSDRLAQGDRYRMTVTLAATGSSVTFTDGAPTSDIPATWVNHQVFVDDLLGVDKSGCRSAVRRKYEICQIAHARTGSKATPRRQALQGRTFTVTRTRGGIRIDNPNGLTTPDLDEVQSLLRDHNEALLKPGRHSVGDTWPIAKPFFCAFNFQCAGTGNCQLESISGSAGSEQARLVWSAEVEAVTAEGQRSKLSLTGEAIWSVPLGRLIHVQYTGPSNTSSTTRRGAVVTRFEAQGTVTCTVDLDWLAVAGTKVSHPTRLPATK